MRNIKITKKDLMYDYNQHLTKELDSFSNNKNKRFNENILNKVILWKVNRYAIIDEKLMSKLNKLKNVKKVNNEGLKNILNQLLSVDGISLPMASTILRFINPSIFQILDRRAYRIIYNKKNFDKKIFSYLKTETVRNRQIETYLDYLKKLEIFVAMHSIEFEKIDRIIYNIDKRVNGAIN